MGAHPLRVPAGQFRIKADGTGHGYTTLRQMHAAAGYLLVTSEPNANPADLAEWQCVVGGLFFSTSTGPVPIFACPLMPGEEVELVVTGAPPNSDVNLTFSGQWYDDQDELPIMAPGAVGSQAQSGPACCGGGGPGGQMVGTMNVIFDGGGAVIPVGAASYTDVEFDFAGVITEASLYANQAGDAVVDIWKSVYAGFPPVIGGSIVGATPPTLAAADKYQDGLLTGWTVAFNPGTILRCVVASASSISRLTLALRTATV